MIHQASWKALFNLLTTVNESGIRNIASFTGAINFKANFDKKMTQLNQAYSFLLVANSTREITILHNLHNFGRTLLHPTDKVGCLVRMGPTAISIIVDHRAPLCSVQEIVPSIEDIGNCPTVNALAALPTPADDGSLINLEVLCSFFPAPFLNNGILAMDLPSPLTLILAGRAAQEEHIYKHGMVKGFNKADVNAHVKLFYLWCIEVHQ
jgi:hypothetical protein